MHNAKFVVILLTETKLILHVVGNIGKTLNYNNVHDGDRFRSLDAKSKQSRQNTNFIFYIHLTKDCYCRFINATGGSVVREKTLLNFSKLSLLIKQYNELHPGLDNPD